MKHLIWASQFRNRLPMELGSLDIIDYWFSENSEKHWFSSTPEIDKEIKQHYEQLWQSAADGKYDEWQNSPKGSLALVIILDQFPLNMFRGHPKSFQTESKAVKIAMNAISHGFDRKLSEEKLLFLFMPLMHSENMKDQDLQVRLFQKYNFNLEYSKHHRDIIKRFGRFPHRNDILGRKSTEAEIKYLQSDSAFKG